jgi:transposase InsO family protein
LTIQRELLDDHPPFLSVVDAQAAVDAWRADYNTSRPHQALDMATPQSRFRPIDADQTVHARLEIPVRS